ncbi:MAG: hypothetical protein JOZ77_12340 [Candidatus Eremiobacteraeota bacterium]|nr:hypothetical protein [Candidatus Eremiobacteraeota bacterium]
MVRSLEVAFREGTLWLCAGALLLSSCSGVTPGGTSAVSLSQQRESLNSGSGSSPIGHIVIIVQENRTFNNLFATFPGATGATVGKKLVGKGRHKRVEPITLSEANLTTRATLNHHYASFLTAYDGGAMDGFNRIISANTHVPERTAPYQYVNPAQVAPYWTMAKEYGLANAMFATQGSDSFPAHQDLIRGGTEIDSTDSLIDTPTSNNHSWGCDSPPGTVTSLITTNLYYELDAGPFPCTSDFPSSGTGYPTLRDLLDAKSVSWKYYTPEIGSSGAIWNAFDVIAPVRYGPEWGTNVSWPETNIFNDIDNGALPSVSWVIPDGRNSDHPHDGSDTGPSWVASVVNAVGQSSYWNSCAIIIVWDDWGGFYDPVPPPLPRDNQGGPGLRVPMIVVSPYARETSSSQPGYISNTVYELGTIVRFVEDTFNLGRLGTTDETTNSMSDMFNLNQMPRPFQTIPAKYPRSYFTHRKPSGLPVDTD